MKPPYPISESEQKDILISSKMLQVTIVLNMLELNARKGINSELNEDITNTIEKYLPNFMLYDWGLWNNEQWNAVYSLLVDKKLIK